MSLQAVRHSLSMEAIRADRERDEDRRQNAEHRAYEYFQQATKRQKAAFDLAMSGLKGAPVDDRRRAEAKKAWKRDTAEASELFDRTADYFYETGDDLSEELDAEWMTLIVKQEMNEAA